MPILFNKTCSAIILLLAFSWINPAFAAVITGLTVANGSSTETGVGLQDDDGTVTYYIPLSDRNDGVYGASSTRCTNGIGTCSDTGRGYGYDDANALTMFLYFDLAGVSNRDNAVLDIWFDDLDLDGINDPDWFFESVSLDATNGTNSISLGPYNNNSAAQIPEATSDPFTWSVSLASLGTLGDDFWVELGFGSITDPITRATNTPEYLTATISTVPVPAAFWLFGTALIGFVGVSRRTRVS